MTLQLPHYENAHVLVVGDVMLDRYWHGATSRISPEAPVPVVHIKEKFDLPGAAANVALNIQTLGSNATLLSMVGDDETANLLSKQLENRGIHINLQRIPNTATITKLRVLSLHQQLIRLDFEEGFHTADPAPLISHYAKQLQQANVVVLSDYAKGVLTQAPTLIKMARQANIPVFVDPKGTDFSLYRGATLLTPNRKEFEAVAGHCPDEETLSERGLAMIEDLQLTALLITRGAEGMTLLRPGTSPLHLAAKRQEVYDVTGAGDTVISVLAASVGAGYALEKSAVLSNLAAGIVINKLGAASITSAELRRALHQEHNTTRGILTKEQAKIVIEDAKAHGERVVMTNGCFDFLHPGHVAYLEEARQLGDYLLVAVNDDASVKRLKGASRPINSLQHRMAVLSGLTAVDGVVSFSEDTPKELIQYLMPDVLVKGSDYDVANIAGADIVLANGGEVKTLSFLEGYSTTAIIHKTSKSETVEKRETITA